jgi:hypothetical protein
VSDGLGQYTGTARIAAEEALLLAQIGCLDQPLTRLLLAQKLRVVQVRVPDTPKRTDKRQGRERPDSSQTTDRGSHSRRETSDAPRPAIVGVPYNGPQFQFEALVRGYSFFALPTTTMTVTDRSTRCR